MSTIHIRRIHGMPLKEARDAAEKVAKQLERDFDLEYAWEGHVLRFARPGVEGELHVTEEDVRLDAKLGLLLGFLKARIEAEVARNLDKLFGEPPSSRPTPAKVPPRKAATKKPTRRSAR